MNARRWCTTFCDKHAFDNRPSVSVTLFIAILLLSHHRIICRLRATTNIIELVNHNFGPPKLGHSSLVVIRRVPHRFCNWPPHRSNCVTSSHYAAASLSLSLSPRGGHHHVRQLMRNLCRFDFMVVVHVFCVGGDRSRTHVDAHTHTHSISDLKTCGEALTSNRHLARTRCEVCVARGNNVCASSCVIVCSAALVLEWSRVQRCVCAASQSKSMPIENALTDIFTHSAWWVCVLVDEGNGIGVSLTDCAI